MLQIEKLSHIDYLQLTDPNSNEMFCGRNKNDLISFMEGRCGALSDAVIITV